MQAMESEVFLYKSVAEDISALIHAGTLATGERVPSVRRLSRQRRISISTVLQAYQLLESRGLIEARPQSGYYVRGERRAVEEPAVTKPPRSPRPVDVHALVSRVLEDRRWNELVAFGTSIPQQSLMPAAKLQRLLSSIARRDPSILTSYTIPPGHEALRRQIALRMRDWGVRLGADDIIITNGCVEAVNLCLRAVAKAGDVIALESPTYFGVVQIIGSLGLKACEIPTFPRHGICLDELEKRLDCCRIKACLFMLNYSNPLGSCMPDEKKARLVEMLAGRNIPLIEDDIYGELAFAPERPKVAKAFDRGGQVLLCSSFCKTLAPGYRVGWIVPGRLRDRVQHLKYVTSVGTATLPQLAIADFLANGGFDHHLRRLRRVYAEQLERVTHAIAKYFPKGTRVTRPTGGYVLWVELPAQIDSIELFDRALEEKISVAPGPIFSPKQQFRNFIRLNCGAPWSQTIDQALLKLGQVIARMM